MAQRLVRDSFQFLQRGHEHHGGEHGSRQAGRALVPLLRAYTFICKQEAGVWAQKANWEGHGLLKLQIPLLGDAGPPTRPYTLMLPNEFFQLGQSIQPYEPVGSILIQPTTSRKKHRRKLRNSH